MKFVSELMCEVKLFYDKPDDSLYGAVKRYL